MLFPGKLKSKRIGLFIVTNILFHCAVEIKSLEISKVFKVNEHRLKLYNDGFQANQPEEL